MNTYYIISEFILICFIYIAFVTNKLDAFCVIKDDVSFI